MRRLRLAFMGTPDFAVPTLKAMVAVGHDVACVYCQPPRAAGRGKKPQESPVHKAALKLDLPVRTPLNFRDPADRDAFAALDLDAAVVAAYGLILPRAILDAPRLGCFNVHASLLPRWRGAAPIHRALLEGDAETGVTIMRMEAGLDTGPMLLTGRTPIGPDDTVADLHDRLAAMGATLMVEALEGIAAGTLAGEPQPETGVTYAAKVDKAEARIDWTRPSAAILRQIRAFTPFPGAWFELGPERIKVHGARPVAMSVTAAPGTTLTDDLVVATGDGSIRLERLQRAGKRVMEADELLRGFAVPAGLRLG
ncbi:MAG: methionyl-tRNA formyltransferase [Pseudomonadota bacterium]|nr:methionyl-tRNA formyltransferase [Pseudomonadota bacterium]